MPQDPARVGQPFIDVDEPRDFPLPPGRALRSLIAWAEDGVAPPPSTGFTMTSDGGIELAADVQKRASIQPIATDHSYDQPGTYFAAFRFGSHTARPDGNPPFSRNIARVRIVVTS